MRFCCKGISSNGDDVPGDTNECLNIYCFQFTGYSRYLGKPRDYQGKTDLFMTAHS